MDRILDALGALVTKRPRATLLVITLLTLPVAWVASSLEVSTARTALVSEDEPHWQRYMAFAREFGIPEDLVVVAEADDPRAVHAFLDDVAGQLVGREDIGPIFYRVDLAAFEERAPFFIDEAALDRLLALARTPAFRTLTTATTPAERLAAIAALIDDLPRSVGAAPDPVQSALLAQGLEALLREMARFAEGGAPPLVVFEGALADAARGGRHGIDSAGYLSAREGRLGVMFVRPPYTRDEIEVVRPFVAAVRHAGASASQRHPSVTFGLTGIPASQIDELETIAEDTRLTTVIALVGVILLFLLYFPALRLLLFALAPVAFGVVWTAAAIRLAFGYVNLMSSIFLVVLIGMGIDFSVHLVSRFLEERRHGHSSDEASRRAVARAGRGIVTGAITSAGAFLAVGWSGFRGIEELGIAASMGLLLTLAFALLVLPAILAWRGGRIDPSGRRRLGVARLVDAVLDHRGVVIVLAVALTVPSLYWASRTPFDFSLLNILPADAESARLMVKMIDERTLSADAVVAVAEDLDEARALTDRIGALDSVHRVVSAASFLPPNQERRLGKIEALAAAIAERPEREVSSPALPTAIERLQEGVERLSELAFARDHKEAVDRLSAGLDAIERVVDRYEADPESTTQNLAAFDEALGAMLEREMKRVNRALAVGPMTVAELPDELRARFVSERGRFAVYAVPKISIWDRPALGRFLDELRAIAPEVTGFPETFYENADRIRSGFLRAAMYATFAVIFLLSIDLRRPSHVAAAMIPVGLGAVWMLGAMNVVDLPYNLANIVGLPLVIGVGIDNGVHILHRYRECGSVRLAAVETGGAVTLSSLTTMVGFGSLAFASHRGYASLGQILFIGVGACWVATLTVLLATLGRGRRS